MLEDIDSLEDLLALLPPRIADKMPEINEDIILAADEQDIKTWAIVPLSLGIIEATNIITEKRFVGRKAVFYNMFPME